MKKKLLIFLFLISPFFVSAYTKEDALTLIEKQNICDEEETIYNEYLNKYVGLIKSKDLNETDINFIYENLNNVINTIKKNNICSLEDLNKLTSIEKDNIVNTLKEILERIKNSSDSNELYDNGEYIKNDSRNEFNYVGIEKYLIDLKYILLVSTIIIFIFLFLSKKKILTELLEIFFVLMLFLDFFYYIYTKYKIDYSYLSIINNKNNINKELTVLNKKVINYPTFASYIGNLKIESININLPIYFNESEDIYKIGLGLVYSFPGFKGRTIISGHNTILKGLENISFNSIINIKTNYGDFSYQVYKIEVLNNDEFSKLDNGDKLLIIYTCYPFNEVIYSNKRYVIYASLEKEVWYD